MLNITINWHTKDKYRIDDGHWPIQIIPCEMLTKKKKLSMEEPTVRSKQKTTE